MHDTTHPEIKPLTILIAIPITVIMLSTLLFTKHATTVRATLAESLAQQQTAFLSVPYYGAKRLTAYFDHDYPNYQINNHIVLYDGRDIPAANGACA